MDEQLTEAQEKELRDLVKRDPALRYLPAALATIKQLRARARELEGALEAVVRCECTFSRDPLEHAKNAVAHCRNLALAALNPDKEAS